MSDNSLVFRKRVRIGRLQVAAVKYRHESPVSPRHVWQFHLIYDKRRQS